MIPLRTKKVRIIKTIPENFECKTADGKGNNRTSTSMVNSVKANQTATLLSMFPEFQQQPGVLQQFVFSREEGCRKPSYDQSERSEKLRFLGALQNVKFTQLEIPPSRKGFSLQDRFQRCLFLNSTSLIVEEICDVSIIWQSIRVFLPVFWSRPYSKDLHETFKGTNGTFTENQYTFSDISRRYSFDGSNDRGNFNEQRHINICPPKFRYLNDHFIHKGKNSERTKHCQELYQNFQTTLLKLTKLIGLLSSTA